MSSHQVKLRGKRTLLGAQGPFAASSLPKHTTTGLEQANQAIPVQVHVFCLPFMFVLGVRLVDTQLGRVWPSLACRAGQSGMLFSKRHEDATIQKDPFQKAGKPTD